MPVYTRKKKIIWNFGMPTNNIRCFVGIKTDNEFSEKIKKIQEEIDKSLFIGKFTKPENLHLTLKFLGELPKEKVDEIREKLREVRANRFTAKTGEIGIFFQKRKSAIIWIKIEGDELMQLQKTIDEKLESLGFEKEFRFMSHMTIARIRKIKVDKPTLKEKISKIKTKGIDLNINEFILFKSDLKKDGPVYSEIETYKLN